MFDRNSRENGSFFIYAISMRSLSRPFECLLLSIFALLLLISCHKRPAPVPEASIYLRGHKISFRDKFKTLEKRYHLLVCPERNDDEMRMAYYFHIMEDASKTDALSCTLWIAYDELLDKILMIEVTYLFDSEIRKKDLEQLSKEVWFDRFKTEKMPFSKTVGNVTYEILVDNDPKAHSSVNYILNLVDK